MKKIKISNEKELNKLAKDLVKNLDLPVVFALEGDIGSGKTTFTKYLAKNLQIDSHVKSPTFTLHREHDMPDKKSKFHHMDFFRIETEKELDEIKFEDILQNNDILVIEWSDKFEKKVQNLSKKATIIRIKFEHLDSNSRLVTIYQ